MSVVKLSRSNNAPWGFRIHGGQDFNTPLIVLKVTGGSIAEQNGLSPGDALLKINGRDALTLKHKQAQDLIVGGGNNLELIVVKNAASTWKPSQVLSENNQVKTSLKANVAAGQRGINPQVNNQAKPYSVQLNEDGNLKLVNNQFNTPINLYSEQNIAETLSAQAEVLAGGAIGVNFKKNEKIYSYENSEVYKMLQEVENERLSSGGEENVIPTGTIGVGVGGHAPGAYAAPPKTQQLRPVRPAAAPVEPPRAQQTIPPAPRAAAAAPAAPPSASGTNPNICADCERLIVGVFVRIKDKNLHVECFKCATCGQSLKNIGYYNINGKLYCDVHAKTVARANPPASGLEPYTTLPTAPAPLSSSQPAAPSGPESIAPAGPAPAGPEPAGPAPVSPAPAGPAPVSPAPVGPVLAPIAIDPLPLPALPLPLPVTESNQTQNQESPSVLNANKPFSYTKGPVSPSVMAPLPYHGSSPSQVGHVTAPSSTTTQISQSIKQSSSSSYSSSEVVTKTATVSPGSKFVWPPSRTEDEIMGIGISDASQLQQQNLQQQQIFQQQQQQLQQQQQTFQQQQNFQSQQSSLLQQQSIPPLVQSIPPLTQSLPPLTQSLPPLTQSLPPPLTQSLPPQLTQSLPPLTQDLNSFLSSPPSNYKPVSAPKSFKQQQVPYKPLSTLLAPAVKATAPAAPQAYVPPPFAAAPAPTFAPAPAPTFAPAPAPTFAPAPAPTFAPAPAPTFAPAPAPVRAPAPARAPAPSFAPAPAAPTPFTPPAPAPSGGAGAGGKGKVQASQGINPIRGRGVLTQPGPRVAVCNACQKQIRGPFITAGARFFCPDHFKCAFPTCARPLIDVGFVEEKNQLFCEFCWEKDLAPMCSRCQKRIKNECLNAIGQHFHPQCFVCTHCKCVFGNNPFFLEDGEPYCDADWNEMFTTKCHGCGFPIEAGDRWVEAMNNSYHSQCFNCSACKKNLEGTSFFAKGGRPFCKAHAR